MKDVILAPTSEYKDSPEDEVRNESEALEERLWQVRRQKAVGQVRRFIAAQEGVDQEVLPSWGSIARPVDRSPDGWKGGFGRDARFPPDSVWVAETKMSPQCWRSALLLALEIVAFVGFVLILAIYYVRLQESNQEWRLLQSEVTVMPQGSSFTTQRPSLGVTDAISMLGLEVTLTPSGLLAQDPSVPTRTVLQQTPVVLTATPWTIETLLRPTATNVTQASLAEMLLAWASPTPAPTRRSGSWLLIPILGLDAPIVEGDDWESLKKGVGHRPGTAPPGANGNCVLAAHNDVYGAWFRDVHTL
ncbi:MAG: sortase, partial [Chloroflexi bacterium]|nr:sortase [Chloroflexota bacterium]